MKTKLSALCCMLALTGFVAIALPSCGGSDGDDTNVLVTPPNNNDDDNNNKPTITDPEGTQDMALKVGNAQSVINGATSVDARYNLTGGMIASLGKVDGLGAITSIPKTGWQTSAPVNIGAGYVVYNEETEVFCRMYIVGQDGEGYHVKYQVPFRGADEELMLSSSEVSFPAEGGTQELTIANSSITPFTVSSSEEWCQVEKIQPGTGVRITCKPTDIGYAGNATVTLTQTSTGKSNTLSVKREGVVPNAVDLGLSVQWCDRNLGAVTVEGIGSYFAWGETEPKDEYGWGTYAYGSSETNVTDIGLNITGTQYDAATNKLGGDWRIPTRAELIELKNNCTWETASVNGVDGYRVTAANGNSIFFADRGGYTSGSTPLYSTARFYGFTANRDYIHTSKAEWYFIFKNNDGKIYPSISGGNYVGIDRCNGLQVRAVKGQPYSDAESYYIKSGTVSGHDYVDLGLSVKWATCNLEANNPWDYGGHYAWTSSNSTWGSSWRMPTKEEMEELLTCKIEWTIYHNTGGYRITGPNGRSIFLPAAGSAFDADDKPADMDEEANYWTSTINGRYMYYFYANRDVNITYGDPFVSSSIYAYYRKSIRLVTK